MAQMEDAVGLYRRLWKGEAIFGHDGPAGRYPLLVLDPTFDEDIPVMAACLGFKTMRWAGRVHGRRDPAHLRHRRGAGSLRGRGARRCRGGGAGSRVRCSVWSVLATLHEPDDERRLRGITGRMATYLQAYGDALVALNGWDPAPLERFRADEVVASIAGGDRREGHHRTARAHRGPHPRGVAPGCGRLADACAARVRRPARRRRRWRDPPRLVTAASSSRWSTPTGPGPARGSVRRARANPAR